MRDVAHVRFATVAFLDRELLANWGFAGSHVRNRNAREPQSVEWSFFGQRVSRQLGFCRAICPKTLRSRIMDCQLDCQLGLSIWAAGPQAWLSVRAASLGCQPGLPTGVPPDPGRRTPCARPPQAKDRIPRCPNRQADSCPVRVGQPSPCVKVWDDRARRALMFLADTLRHAHQASICSPRSTLAQRVAGDSAHSVNANNLS